MFKTLIILYALNFWVIECTPNPGRYSRTGWRPWRRSGRPESRGRPGSVACRPRSSGGRRLSILANGLGIKVDLMNVGVVCPGCVSLARAASSDPSLTWSSVRVVAGWCGELSWSMLPGRYGGRAWPRLSMSRVVVHVYAGCGAPRGPGLPRGSA